MEKLQLITAALGLIETHLTQDLRTADLARALHCSKSSLEKLFWYTTGMSIRDYVVRRRMSRAARDIAASPDLSLLDLAFQYGYGSNEAFTRAFRQVWHVTPSEYRKNPLRFELFPALRLDPELMEDETMTSKKKVDISELYDYIQQRHNCYFVGVDIKSLMP
ncbi:MAG: helix-turn-helix transcriptional regulator, partial [Candidatus Spyradocola sp.]